MLRAIFLISTMTAAGVFACSKEEKNKKVSADVDFKMQAVNSKLALSTDTSFRLRSDAPSLLANTCSEAAHTNSATRYLAAEGTTGAPDSVKIYIESISLSDSINKKELFIFKSEDAGGTEVALSSGKVDLSSLKFNEEFEFEKDSDPSTYRFNLVRLIVKNKALVKGCLEDEYRISSGGGCQAAAGTFGTSCESWAESGTSVTFKACTKTAYSTSKLAETPSAQLARSAYKDGDAEETLIHLRSKGQGNPISAIDLEGSEIIEYPVPGEGFKLDGSKIDVNMAVDLNAFLRFDANIRKDMDAFSDMVNKPFFFANDLKNLAVVTVGEPGAVEGYLATECVVQEEIQITKNWLTLLFDAEGSVIGGLTVPFDPSGFVVLNGSVSSQNASTRATTKSGDEYTIRMTESGLLPKFKRLSEVGDSAYLPTSQESEQTGPSGSPGPNKFDFLYTRKL